MPFLQVISYSDKSTCKRMLYYTGWIDTIQNDELRIFQLGYLKSNTEVLKSLSIREDFSWAVSYKREVVNPSYCDQLKDIPTSLNSGIIQFVLQMNVHCVYFL